MTFSILRRVNSFIEYGNPLSMTILTFDHRQSSAQGQDNLAHNGYLADVVVARNMWDDIGLMSDEQLREAFSGHTPTRPILPADGEKKPDTKNYAQFVGNSGRVVREEHYRDDETSLFTDSRPAGEPRRILLHAADGKPVIEFARLHDVYNQWIKHIIDKDPSVLVADPGIVANITSSLGHRRFKLVHFLHVSHLENPVEGAFGELVKARAEALQNFDQFDFTAVQTQKQIDDMTKIGFPRHRMHLIPSELSPNAITDAHHADRDETKGIIAGRLVELKQIDHAITATAQAKKATPSLTLDIYGTGTERNHLQTLIDDQGLDDEARLHGHVGNLTQRLTNASFSLLTSKYEGLGLVILESMAAGCIPITYDIRYGPGGIITHGVNGFIVDANDTTALATQITEFLNLDPDTKQAMREAAVERAREFLPERSHARWRTALEAPITPPGNSSFQTSKLRVREAAINARKDTTRIGLVFADRDKIDADSLQLIIKHRSTNTIIQTVSSANGWQRTDGRVVYNFLLTDDLFTQSAGQTFDVFARNIGADWNEKIRLSVPTTIDRVETGKLTWYRTQHGNLSLKVR